MNLQARKIWIIEYVIDGKTQRDGEWWTTRSAATNQAETNERDMGWGWRVTSVTLPMRPANRGGK